ncbi:MAG: hypothetical protein WA476_15865 [Acidobacteriaceae bacterium]
MAGFVEGRGNAQELKPFRLTARYDTRTWPGAKKEIQVHSPIRLTCGSLRVTVSALIVAPESGATYSDASLRMTVFDYCNWPM